MDGGYGTAQRGKSGGAEKCKDAMGRGDRLSIYEMAFITVSVGKCNSENRNHGGTKNDENKKA